MTTQNKNIILVGLMGSGKTTLGKFLAQKTSMEFIDTDELIVQKAQKPITKIFEEDGEPHFRDLETEITKQVSQIPNCIISTGGGIVLRDENIENLKKAGALFYLEASPEELYDRVKNDSSRPLLKTDNPLETLQNLLKTRQSRYEKADFKINTEQKSLEDLSKQILQLYQQYSA